jgi:transcriptional regulator with XRE-family HTH domain
MELRVKEVCKDKGVTLAEIASKIGVAQASLSKMLGGNPTIGTLEKIATALDVPMWQLFASPEEVQLKKTVSPSSVHTAKRVLIST